LAQASILSRSDQTKERMDEYMPDRNAELKAIFDSDEFESRFHTDEPLGVICGELGTTFTLWAPTAQNVTLNLYGNGHEGWPYASVPMERGKRGVWKHESIYNLDGTYYDYDVTADGVTRRTGDPYARACGLNGWRSMVIDLARTDPDGWEGDRAPMRQKEDVIYEIHVKDFSWDPAGGVPQQWRGKYKALTLTDTTMNANGRFPTCAAHVRRLGVTHVQLMPVYDYGSVDEAGSPDSFNWGYDPMNYNVPEGSYSTDPYRGEVRIRELKEAVMALHRSGFRVIMDVVYNHTQHLESHLFKTVPWYHYRQNTDGTASNGSGCGSELASERSMCGRYILDSVLYWAEEYHMDGFRFDLMGLLDVPLMNRIQSELDRRYGEGEKLIYGEPWGGGRSAQRPGTLLCHKGSMKKLMPAIGAFCDNTRDAVKGSVFDAKHRGFANGGEFNAQWLACCVRGWAGDEIDMPFAAPSQTISYLSSHDDWTLFDKLVISMTGERKFVQMTPEVFAANKLAAAILFMCQGRLFMLSGEEFARTKIGVRNTYRTTLRINRLDWKRAHRKRALTEYYRGLIALRKTLPGLCDKSQTACYRVLEACDIAPGAGYVRMDNRGEGSGYDTLLLAVNTGREACRMTLTQGEWQILADADSSFLWQKPCTVSGAVQIQPVSAMILGKKPIES